LQSIDDILNKEGKEGVQRYRKSLQDNNRVVSGQTAQSIKYSVKNSNTLIFTADDHITALEDGRKPTKSTGGSGNGFFEQIEQWVLDRGIHKSAAYPIYKKINEKGYKGTKGLLTIPSEEILTNTKKALIDGMLLNAKTSFKTFKDK
jgi:hypothetical protein